MTVKWHWAAGGHGLQQCPGLSTRGRAAIASLGDFQPGWLPLTPSAEAHAGQAGAILASLDYFPL